MGSELYDRFVKVRKCAACGEILAWSPHMGAFCADCLPKWDFAKVQSCPDCLQSAIECTCMPKFLSDSGALFLCKLFFYRPERHRDVPNRLIYYIKRNQNRRVFGFLAEELLSVLRNEWKKTGEELSAESMVFVSIPRGYRARSTYGFDQSDKICRAMSEQSGIPYLPVIRRRLGGFTQKTLNRRERLRNMKRRLALRERVLERTGTRLSEKTVILFDDVVTTGSTMAAAAELLRRAGVRQILCLTIAADV